MPKETIWHPEAVTNNDEHFTITWGNEQPAVHIAGIPVDRSAINRIIRALRTARNKTYGHDE